MSEHTEPPDGLPEGARIDVEQEEELRRWAARLGTDPQRLRAAVAEVGPGIRRLRSHLAGTAGPAVPRPDEDPHDANGPAGPPHYDIHREAS